MHSMLKMFYVSLLVATTLCSTQAFGMKGLLAKRKTSLAQADAPAQAPTSPALPRTKSLDSVKEKDISEQLREVLKLQSRYPYVSVISDDEEDGSEEESDDFPLMPKPTEPAEPVKLVKVASLSNISGRKLLTSAQGLAASQENVLVQPVTTVSPRLSLRTSARAIEVGSSDDGSASTPEPLDAIEKSSCKACTNAYHGRNKLGLTFQWLHKLPTERIKLQGKELTITQQEQLLALLRVIPEAITCNLETLADDDEEKVIVDVTKLPQFLLEGLTETNAPARPITQTVREEVVVYKEIIKEVEAPLSLAQKNAGLLEKCHPVAIRLLQNGDIQNATLAQKTIAKAWILQNLHAITTNADGAILIELSEISKQTKVPHTLDKSPGTIGQEESLVPVTATTQEQSSTTILRQVAIPVIQGASLIGIGYLLAQLFHK